MVAMDSDIFADLLADRANDTFLPPVPVEIDWNAAASRNDEKVVPFVQVDVVHGSPLSG